MDEKPLKILYLITKSNFGGAQRYVYDLARETARRGHVVTVGFGGNGPLATKLSDAGIRTIPIPTLERDVNPLNEIKVFFALLDIFATVGPDIVHLNSSKMGGLGALAARLWNGWAHMLKFLGIDRHAMRIIFTGHGWAFNEERSDSERFLIASLHWFTLALAHQTIAVSHKTREQVSRLPFVGHKISVVHNGVGVLTTLSKNDALTKLLGEKKDALLANTPLVVGTLAELHKNKGLSYALEGIALAKKQLSTPLIFLVLGEGEERAHLEGDITRLGLENAVFLLGHIEDGMSFVSAFDIFLLPSITEAFPYAILEAGKAGIPVVATAVGGIPEVIDDMESGILIQSKNPGEVARALVFLAQDAPRRTQLGDAIRERIGHRFTLDTMVAETLSVYTKTV